MKWKNSSCSACGRQLQDSTHLFLNCPASEPLRRDFSSRPWPDLMSLRVFSPHPILGRGRVAPPSPVPDADDDRKCCHISPSFCIGKRIVAEDYGRENKRTFYSGQVPAPLQRLRKSGNREIYERFCLPNGIANESHLCNKQRSRFGSDVFRIWKQTLIL